MTIAKRGLGRGLDALLGGAAVAGITEPRAPMPAEPETTTAPRLPAGAVRSLPVDLIDRSPFQPRREFDPEKLEELAQSIRAQGVVQPILVRPLEGGRYQLVAGERRWRAAQRAGLTEIPAQVRALDDASALAVALIENVQREDLPPLDEALALRRLIAECGLTHEQCAESVGRSRPAVSNLLRLLDLEPAVQELLGNGSLDLGHAKVLLGLTGDAQVGAARVAANQGLTVRETERLIQRLKTPVPAPASVPRDPDIARMEERLSMALACRVRIEHRSATGRGRLVLEYASLDAFEGLLARIGS